jgi:uncharacterized membrane protein
VVGAILIAPLGIATLVAADFEMNWLLLAGLCGVFEVIYFLLLQRGYRDGDVSLVYPLARGTGPTLSVLGAILILGERPSLVARFARHRSAARPARCGLCELRLQRRRRGRAARQR